MLGQPICGAGGQAQLSVQASDGGGGGGDSAQPSDSKSGGAVAAGGVKMKLSHPPHSSSTTSILDILPDHILLNILQRLTHHFDRQSWSLACKQFLLLEASCRTRLSLLRTYTLPSLTRRYPHLQHLNLSPCTFLTDKNLMSVAQTAGKRLLSLNLAKVRTFTDVGLVVLAKECVSLLDLDLSRCFQVKDPGIIAIAQIKTLQSLKLNDCKGVTDRGLVFLASSCKKLQSLGLKWCVGITDDALLAIGAHCLELRELDLSYTEITKTGLSAISKLSVLEKLSLIACNRVDDEGLTHLKNGSKFLQTLDVSGCRSVSHKGIMGLANSACPLQHITLSYCVSVTDAMLHSLLRFNGLQSIRFDGCDMTGVDLGLVGKCCKNLKELSLCKCKGVTDAGLSTAVRGCSGLENIDLTCCREVTDEGLSFIASFCKGLISLKMESCSQVSEHGVHKLGDSCQCLEELDFTDSSLNDAGLMSVAKCRSMRALKLGFCESVHDKGLFYIASNCSNLRELDLYRSLETSDAGIAAICNGCKRLISLNLSYCTNITDTALLAVAQLGDLGILEIRGCTGVSTLGLIAVAKGCQRLVELDIKRCTSMEDFAPFALAQNCKNLRQINMSYCTATDEGVVALAKLHCMQNMRLIHVKKVSIKGFSELLLAGESLKKVKLLLDLKHTLPPWVIDRVQKRGCRLRWMEKQL